MMTYYRAWENQRFVRGGSCGRYMPVAGLVYAHGLLARISLYRNDLHRAREAADAGGRYLAGWGRGHSMSWVAWPRALLCEAEGQGGQALSTMAALWDWCASSGLVLELPAIGADLVRFALAAGEVPRARQAADAMAEVAAQRPGLDDR